MQGVNVDGNGLKGTSRATISPFKVEFATKDAASASSSKIGHAGRANLHLQITLMGLTPADQQAIADALCAEFDRDLKGLGLGVLSTAQVLASPRYTKMAASGMPSPTDTRTNDTRSTVFAPPGQGLYGAGSSNTALPMLAGLTAISDISGTLFGHVELARDRDAALIGVHPVVNL